MRLMQLIYVSRPFGFDAGSLDDILTSARRCNERDDVTGALICRRDIFLQLLEGPRAQVTATFGRILRDDRHAEVTLICCGDTPFRLFRDWSMRDDPVRSWMWSRDQLQERDIRSVPALEAREVFGRLAREPHLGWRAAH